MNFTGEGNPRVTKQCEHCDKSYRTRNPERKYCNKDCRKAADNERNGQEKLDTGFLKIATIE